MTDPDQAKPYHAKNTAPGQEAADVVAEVLQHAAEREAAVHVKSAPKGPPKWMLPLTVNLGVLALYFLIAQPEFINVNQNVDRRPVAERLQQTEAMMVLSVGRINSFHAREGRLPASLAEANDPTAGQGVDYTVQGDSSFILIATVDDQTIIYDSTAPGEFGVSLSSQLPG